jgi:hypothetical protein
VFVLVEALEGEFVGCRREGDGFSIRFMVCEERVGYCGGARSVIEGPGAGRERVALRLMIGYGREER